MKGDKLTCKRCGCKWNQRFDRSPKQCRECKSFYWQTKAPVRIKEKDKPPQIMIRNRERLTEKQVFILDRIAGFTDKQLGL